MNENRIVIDKSENICRIYFKGSEYASITIFYEKIKKEKNGNIWLYDSKNEVITIIYDNVTYLY
jgi:hypothetical protein